MNIIIGSVIIAFIAAITYFKRTAIREWLSHYQIKKANDELLGSDSYYLMRNVVLKIDDSLHKFDFIIVSRFGFFVVMTEHHSGIIAGSDNDATWTQIGAGKVSTKFANPSQMMKQKCETLSTLLKVPKAEVYPVVLFTAIAGFRTPMNSNITTPAKYLEYVQSINKVLFNTKQIEKFVRVIEAKRCRKSAVNQTEQSEQQFQQGVSLLLQDSVCPKCGSDLEIKKLDSGISSERELLVCALFPTCRHSRSL